MTREEIEAAREIVLRYENSLGEHSHNEIFERRVDSARASLAGCYIAERAERQRRIEEIIVDIREAIGLPLFPHAEHQIRDIITRHLDGETT